MEKKKEKNNESLSSWGRYSGLAFQMAAIICIGVFGGLKIDRALTLKFPVFLLLFSILSVAAAIYFAVKDLLKK